MDVPVWKDITSADIESIPFRSSKKTVHVDEIFAHVGLLLTCWERMLSDAAELFDIAASPSGHKSNRVAFAAFSAISSPAGQADVLKSAANRGAGNDQQKDYITKIAVWLDKLSVRRNEVAHGQVVDLEEHGFMLCPNNISQKKWTDTGSAKYQLTAESISKSSSVIVQLHQNILFVIALIEAGTSNSPTA